MFGTNKVGCRRSHSEQSLGYVLYYKSYSGTVVDLCLPVVIHTPSGSKVRPPSRHIALGSKRALRLNYLHVTGLN